MLLVLPVYETRGRVRTRSFLLEDTRRRSDREKRKTKSSQGERRKKTKSGSGNDRPSALEANIDECPALLALRSDASEEPGIALFPLPLSNPPCHPFFALRRTFGDRRTRSEFAASTKSREREPGTGSPKWTSFSSECGVLYSSSRSSVKVCKVEILQL